MLLQPAWPSANWDSALDRYRVAPRWPFLGSFFGGKVPEKGKVPGAIHRVANVLDSASADGQPAAASGASGVWGKLLLPDRGR